ncbi:MAG TPA: Sjogren's syndrome/scleroderma autoantigen 1 family protein [Nitrososphaerales archaeon]|nr:Sjogren's syndrome/scleroderma autoantigen 1 family protein [Nitrososphaerales archaeon]
MAATAELMIKGATLLREACPKCGGVQIKFQGRNYCTAEDNLEKALLQDSTKEEIPSNKPEAKAPGPASEQLDSLESILEKKLSVASEQLEKTTDVGEQAKLLDLISKYVETLGKLKKTA